MIEAKEITKFYGKGESRFQVLKNISIKINDGDFTVILGASGSGKSTLLNTLSSLERPDGGSIFYDKMDITTLSDNELTKLRRDNIGFIFQQYYLLPNMNVDKNVKMGADLSGNKNYQSVIEAVGLGGKLRKYPSELSGGEQQRVSIARAIAKNPKLLLCDEPTGALDYVTGKKILKLLYDVSRERKRLVIIVTHNSALKDMADKVIYLKSGEVEKIVENEHPIPIQEIEW